MWLGGVHVVDAQVEGRADFEFREHTEGRHATGGVHQRGQRPAMNHAGFGIADNLRAIRQHNRQSFVAGAVNA
ncbi:hypothetical protein D3C72_2352290 [compost metagenome]